MTKAVIVAIAMSAVGCTTVYEVHRGSGKISGIPFYVQVGACTQETVYLETVYNLTIQALGAEKVPPVVVLEKPIAASVYASEAMQTLRATIAGGSASLATISQQFNRLDRFSPAAAPEVILASNVTKPDRFVDYTNVHYVNVKKPLMGSASAAAKLNADGTLAESAAEVEDKTVETLLSAVPVSEILLGAVGSGGAADFLPSIAGMDPTKGRPLQLVVTPTRFKHTLTKTERGDVPCVAKPQIKLTDETANKRREAVNDGDKAKEDENTIGVSGKIVLPKKGGS